MIGDKKEIFVITGSKIVVTGKMNYKFMLVKDSPIIKYSHLSNTFGWLRVESSANRELKFMGARKMSNKKNDEWVVSVFSSTSGLILSLSSEKSREGLCGLINMLPKCVLLMEREIFSLFEGVVGEFPNISLGYYHSNLVLSTS